LIAASSDSRDYSVERAVEEMFDYFLKVLSQIDNGFDKSRLLWTPGQNVLLSQVNSIDSHGMVAHVVKHLLDSPSNRLMVNCFDDSFGPIHNLLKHIGCQPDTFIKTGALHTVAGRLIRSTSARKDSTGKTSSFPSSTSRRTTGRSHRRTSESQPTSSASTLSTSC